MFISNVVYKMRPEDIDWFLNIRDMKIPENNRAEGEWARWVQQTFDHKYAYMVCPANRKKLEDIVNGQ